MSPNLVHRTKILKWLSWILWLEFELATILLRWESFQWFCLYISTKNNSWNQFFI